MYLLFINFMAQMSQMALALFCVWQTLIVTDKGDNIIIDYVSFIMCQTTRLLIMVLHKLRFNNITSLRKSVGATVNIYFSDRHYLIIWRPLLNYLAAAT